MNVSSLIRSITREEIVNFASILAAFICSVVVALLSVNWQSDKTTALEASLRFEEVVLELHDSLSECQSSFQTSSNSDYSHYLSESKKSIVFCRNRVRKMRAALKILSSDLAVKKASAVYDHLTTFNAKLLAIAKQLRDSDSSLPTNDDVTDKIQSLIGDENCKQICIESIKAELE